jgi:hypothetical protein
VSARKSHSPIQEAAVCGVTGEGAAAGAARGATPRVTVGATGEAGVLVGGATRVGIAVAAGCGLGRTGARVAVAEGDGRGGAAVAIPGEDVRAGATSVATILDVGVAVGVNVGVGLGVGVELSVGVDLAVEVEGGLAVAVGGGAAGAALAGGGEGTEGRGFTGGVGVAATRETSAVGVARRAMTTFGPQETEDSRRAAAQRVGSLRNVGVSGALLRRAFYLAGISASDNRSLPAGTFSSFVVFPEGQRTVTRSAVSASPRPK